MELLTFVLNVGWIIGFLSGILVFAIWVVGGREEPHPPAFVRPSRVPLNVDLSLRSQKLVTTASSGPTQSAYSVRSQAL